MLEGYEAAASVRGAPRPRCARVSETPGAAQERATHQRPAAQPVAAQAPPTRHTHVFGVCDMTDTDTRTLYMHGYTRLATTCTICRCCAGKCVSVHRVVHKLWSSFCPVRVAGPPTSVSPLRRCAPAGSAWVLQHAHGCMRARRAHLFRLPHDAASMCAMCEDGSNACANNMLRVLTCCSSTRACDRSRRESLATGHC